MERTLTEIAAAHDERVSRLSADEVFFYQRFRDDLAECVGKAGASANPLLVETTAFLAAKIVEFNARVVDAGHCVLSDAWLFAGMAETLTASLHRIGPQAASGSLAEWVARGALRTAASLTSLQTVGAA